jgi:DNA-binding CsgD family transcriptional regulator
MVGRSRELARLRSLLRDALAGEARLVLCTGEAGIGKTRLAEELAASAASAGVPVAWARATDRGSSPPYGLWKLVLEELATRFGPGEGRATMWANVLGAADGAMVESAEAAGSRRFELFAQLRRRLTELAEDNGLVLVLDDVQWADEASTAFLVDLGRQLRGARIFVLATYRDPSSGNETGRAALLPLSADAGTERVDLSGLPPNDVAALLLASGLPASPGQVGSVQSQTGGNPFLVKEVARALTEARGAPAEPLPVPVRVVEATEHRLSQLSEPAQAFLRAASVAGNGFSIGVVARMLDRPVLALAGPLEECGRAGFLVKGDRPGEHRFSHALVRSAVVARLPAADERLLHAAAAEAIEGFYEGQLRPHLAGIAHHRVEASLPGERQPAVAACEAAANVASEALAYEEAARLYREALSVGGQEIGAGDRARLDLGLAAALYGMGDLAGWHETAVAVGRAAEQRRDHLALAHTALVMEATGDPTWDAEVCRVCEAALVAELPTGLSVRVRSRYARALVYRNRLGEADEVSRGALQLAESTSDPAVLIEALHARQLARSGPDGTAERSELAARMLEAAPLVGSSWAEMWGRLWRVDTLFETGQLVGVQREIVDLESCLRRVAGPLGRWHFLVTSATLAMATARFSEARRCAEEAFALTSNMSFPATFGACAVILGQVGMHIGFDASGMTALFEQLPARFQPDVADTTAAASSVFPALSVAMMALQRGDRATAERAYALAGPVESWAPVVAMSLSCWAHGLLVAIGLDRKSDIEYLAQRFEPFRGLHTGNGGGSGVYMGPVELQLGKAGAALGSLDKAARDLETALALCRSNGARGYAVEAAVELAATLTRRGAAGDSERARSLLDEAAPEADRLGMAVFTQRIDSSRSGALVIRALLSGRELEVADLVRQGLTNKQIAKALFVSERTAENHVQHILTKLGLANRAQVAAWASDAGTMRRPVVGAN